MTDMPPNTKLCSDLYHGWVSTYQDTLSTSSPRTTCGWFASGGARRRKRLPSPRAQSSGGRVGTLVAWVKGPLLLVT